MSAPPSRVQLEQQVQAVLGVAPATAAEMAQAFDEVVAKPRDELTVQTTVVDGVLLIEVTDKGEGVDKLEAPLDQSALRLGLRGHPQRPLVEPGQRLVSRLVRDRRRLRQHDPSRASLTTRLDVAFGSPRSALRTASGSTG